MSHPKIKQAIHDLQQGKMIIVTDDQHRENEGDLIMAAEKITPEAINFMIKQGGGLVCLAMSGEDIDRLALDFMNPTRKNDDKTTPFTISIDARYGTTTGISAFERAHTILTAIDPKTTAHDLLRPGHVFPLRAETEGVLSRAGHTEAAVDLTRLAGLKPAGVICEIIGETGEMLRGEALKAYAEKHGLTLISIEELIAYRLIHEMERETKLPSHAHRMQKTARCVLNTSYGAFDLSVYDDTLLGVEHVVLSRGDLSAAKQPLVRVHSSCMTGEVFHSLHCDCEAQLSEAMRKIAVEGEGLIIYLAQEGRGIGLKNKILAYALQTEGHDTMTANLALGLPIDARDYAIAADILKQYDFSRIRLMTNNPHKVAYLQKYLSVTIDRIPHQVEASDQANAYLATKRDLLGHLLA